MQIDTNIPEVARRQIERIAEVCERIKPLVVIRCITYNHEAFLKDALEGFLMQKTDFPFVAVVHDDASTDGTAAVLRKYAEQYPDIILPIYEEENQYSKRNSSVGRIMNAASKATGAKYVAMCEGDDYWTYEYKLQKQVDFLESHPDYSMVFHNAIVHYEGKMTPEQNAVFRGYKLNDGDYQNHLLANLREGDYDAIEFVKDWFTPTASIVFTAYCIKSHYYKKILESKDLYYADIPLVLTCVSCGKAYCFNEIMSCYRIHSGGVSFIVHTAPMSKKIKVAVTLMNIFDEPMKSFYKKHIAKDSVQAIRVLFKGNVKESLSILRLCLKYNPLQTIVNLLTYPFDYLKRRLKRK